METRIGVRPVTALRSHQCATLRINKSKEFEREYLATQ